MEFSKNISSNPHIRSKQTTSKIMLMVIMALIPTSCVGVYNFGLRALFIIIITVATTVLSEFTYQKLMKKDNTIGDFSAVLTGLLLALNLPVNLPYWMCVLGGIFAIIVVKMLFGGLGQNFMNPALGARCFLMISFTQAMTDFVTDVYTGPTPLAALAASEEINLNKMILGFTGGTIGETSMIALVIGAIFLVLIGVIDLKVPFSYIISFILFLILFSDKGIDPYFIAAHLSGGGLMLGAFFMATDYVTRPISAKGQIIFGILLGFLTAIFRVFGASTEGVSYAIIIGNLMVPLIDKMSIPKPFGRGGE